jgi:molybdopterin-guanine dinucleotide biosynthesis protein A
VLASPAHAADKNGMWLGAIILAGGRSERMGQPKESLPFRGDTLLGHLAHTLTSCCERVVVVARDEAQPLPPLPEAAVRVHDVAIGVGPLAGVVAGMRRLRGEGFGADDAAFVIACDHALVTAKAVRAMCQWLDGSNGDAARAHDAVVPQRDGVVEPLCALYRLRVLPTAEHLLATPETGPRALVAAIAAFHLEGTALRRIDPELEFLRDVDTPRDYDDLRRHDG